MADEIKLVSDTLDWLNSLKDEEIEKQVFPKMRDLVANLIDFQYGFSLPIDLGMGGRSDKLSQTLPIENKAAPLIRFQFAYKVDPSAIVSFEPNDHVLSDDRVYCFAGGATWESLIESGHFEADSAAAQRPLLDSTNWLKDLFLIFDHCASVLDSDRKNTARRLAACWYNIATTISFDENEEELVDLGMEKSNIMAMMLGLTLGQDQYDDGDEYIEEEEEDENQGEENTQDALKELISGKLDGLADEDDPDYDPPNDAEYNEEDEEDEEYDENGERKQDTEKPAPSALQSLLSGQLDGLDDDDDEDYDPENDPNDDGQDEDFEEEEEYDENGEEKQDTEKPAPSALQSLLSGQLDGLYDDDDEDYDPENDPNDNGEDEDFEEEEEIDDQAVEDGTEAQQKDEEEGHTDEDMEKKAQEFREIVLSAVSKLSAQWPSVEDMSWMKRVLKMMSIADGSEKEWYPWGLPPLEPLQKLSESSDPLERQHAMSVLSLYRPTLEKTAQ